MSGLEVPIKISLQSSIVKKRIAGSIEIQKHGNLQGPIWSVTQVFPFQFEYCESHVLSGVW